MNRDTTANPQQARLRHHDPDDSEAHVHRRDTDDEAVMRLHDRVGDAEESIKRINDILGELVPNMRGLTENTGRLADVLEAWSNIKGFWWTLRMVSGGVKIVLPIVLFAGALVAAIWLFGKTGQWEFRA